MANLLDFAKDIGKGALDLLKDIGRGALDLLKDLAGSVLALFACQAGVAGYYYSKGWVRAFGGGTAPRRLSSTEKTILVDVFTAAGIAVDLEPIRLRLSVDLRGIGGVPAGLTLANDIYLAWQEHEYDCCDPHDMRLLAHEVAHVAQYQQLGIQGFACLYGALIAADFNVNNALEKQASEVEKFVTDDLVNKHCEQEREHQHSARPDWFWLVWN